MFVRTDATPTGFVDLQVPGVEWLPSERQREIVAELRDRPHATAAELAEAVDVTKEHVRKTLRRLQDADVVRCREGAGEHGAHVYSALSGLGEGEVVEVGETANDDVWRSYTWSFAIFAPDDAISGAVTVSSGLSAHSPVGENARETSTHPTDD